MGWLGGDNIGSEIKDLGNDLNKGEKDKKKYDKNLKELLEMKSKLNNERNKSKKDLNKIYGTITDTSKKTNREELLKAAKKLKEEFEDFAKREEDLAKIEAAIVNNEERASSRIKMRIVDFTRNTIIRDLESFISRAPTQHGNNQDIAIEIEEERRQLGLIVNEIIEVFKMEEGKTTNSEFGDFVKEQRGQL